ncbi:MAG TPA: hypothetical protein VKY54_12290 [Kiloniellales bacterium]|jgi:hypothetical protein|nr:hypothetical protein [Kiloniellales bacterium]
MAENVGRLCNWELGAPVAILLLTVGGYRPRYPAQIRNHEHGVDGAVDG